MDLSIVIPAYNEEESLDELLKRVTAAVEPLDKSYEIIVVDDGSTDGTFKRLQELRKQYAALRIISFRRNYGKSPALAKGFEAARGEVVITMDADLQDDPHEIPNLLNKLDEGYDLVSGWKKKRRDPLSKTIPSRIFNRVTSWLTGIKIHDFNCGLKAYRREVVKAIQVYGELHRFLPVMAHWQGFRVGEVVVKHHPRRYGKSKFGVKRLVTGAFDLITVLFLTRFRASPLHVFGSIGLVTFLTGFAIEVYLTALKFFYHQGIGRRPLFFLGILLLIVGVQFVGFGLVAEMISAQMAEKAHYAIKAEIPRSETVPEDGRDAGK
ncbi:MAG: glycosyltransferase [Calditrichaeota bacterium]|nr:MAG: glycosyltransferase [Calditrichota bacterium]